MDESNFDVTKVFRDGFMIGSTRHVNWDGYHRKNSLMFSVFPEKVGEQLWENLRIAFMLGFSRNYVWSETEGITVAN